LAAKTRIGPVVVPLTSRHGIHVGDLIGSAVLLVLAGLITRRLRQDG